MEQILLYAHGGSKNHGCEAIAKTTAQMLKADLTLYSQSPEDRKSVV